MIGLLCITISVNGISDAMNISAEEKYELLRQKKLNSNYPLTH